MTRIALDAMSGDRGYPVACAASVIALRRFPGLELILVGDPAVLEPELARGALSNFASRVRIQAASEVVAMDEEPTRALRNKKDSSMRVAINLVRDGEADACVSAGNTGALMATARFVLKMIPGIDRPAIISAIPSALGETHMLDLGANAECRAEHLYQFAVMGSVVATAVTGKASPSIGLLNIGAEAIKGNQVTRDAAELLRASTLNFTGYVEGNDVYSGAVDVVVCDGFTGNVALKTSEGVAKLIGKFLRDEFRRNLLTRLAGIVALPVLLRFRDRADPRHYNGASFVGVQGIVIKSHGGADAKALANAIRIAELEIEKSVPARIGKLVAEQMAATGS